MRFRHRLLSLAALLSFSGVSSLSMAQTPSFNSTSKALTLPVLALSDGSIVQQVSLSLYDGGTWQLQSVGSSGKSVPTSSNTYPLKTTLVGFPSAQAILPTEYRLTLANGQIWRYVGTTSASVNVSSATDPKKPAVTIYSNATLPGYVMQFADDATLLSVLPTSDVDPQVVAALGNAGVPVTASTAGNLYPLKTTLYRFAGSIPPGFRVTLGNGQIWKSTATTTVSPTSTSSSPAVVLYRDSNGYTLQFVDSATSLSVEPTNDVDNTVSSGSSSGGSSGGSTSTPSALAVAPASLSLYPTKTASLALSGGTPPYQAVSSNTAVVRVTSVDSSTGLVQLEARAAVGTATITAVDKAGQTASATITVALPTTTTTQ
jgi:hypothetical protein